jgi:LPS sulfotransferase NodH
MPNKKALCIVAGQRAGTTALQSALASTGKFHDFGEIFHTGDDRRKGAFIDYAREKGLLLADTATAPQVRAQFLEYVNFLETTSGGKYPLVDIKLNSWGALRPFWAYSHQEPMLLSELKSLRTGFIFVARKDITAQILSEQIARRADRWHQLSADAFEKPFTVDVRAVANQARLTILSEQLMISFLRNYDQLFMVWYEDLYVDGVVRSSLKNWVNTTYGLTITRDLAPGIKRNEVNKQEAIENFGAAHDAIDDVVRKFGRIAFESF